MSKGGSRPISDGDVMLHADGELDPAGARAVERELTHNLQLQQKSQALRQLGELVRTRLEGAADAAEPKLARLWDEIDKRLDLAQAPAVATPPAARAVTGDHLAETSAWGRWMSRFRGHLVAAAIGAGAVAAVVMVTRSPSEHAPAKAAPTALVIRDAGTREAPPQEAPEAAMVPVVRRAPAVDSVEVPHGSGTVFTIEDEDGTTAVIWVTADDVVEGI